MKKIIVYIKKSKWHFMTFSVGLTAVIILILTFFIEMSLGDIIEFVLTTIVIDIVLYKRYIKNPNSQQRANN